MFLPRAREGCDKLHLGQVPDEAKVEVVLYGDTTLGFTTNRPGVPVVDMRPGKIADPVHGYVNFTGIERAILDHRVAQRLRYISQTGLAHLVFPELRSSRFSHSLGAMHLTTRFLESCLKNAGDDVKEQLGLGLREIIREAAGSTSEPEEAARQLEVEAVLTAKHYCASGHESYFLFAEQSLRLAALFHDLGHLPYSHDFEYALADHWRDLDETGREASPLKALLQQHQGQSKVHERLGHEVALLLLKELRSHFEGGLTETVRICFELAQKILVAEMIPEPSQKEAALFWLHTIMDGEIDVDRCDYILRDGRNYGFEFATYDLNRLLDNVVVTKQDGSFVMAIKSQGLSAIETFLLSRFRSYQYGVRHHKVAQIGAALRHCIKRILSQGDVQAFLNDIGTLADADSVLSNQRSALLARFAKYDDAWWMGIMRDQLEAHPDEWLELICWRKSGPRSLWKRPSDFQSLLALSLQEWNEALPDPDDLDRQARWFEIVSNLEEKGVLVVRHDFTTWKVDEFGKSLLHIVQTNGNLMPVSDASPVVRVLQEAWMQDIQVHAFVQSDAMIGAKEVVETLLEIQGGKDDG